MSKIPSDITNIEDARHWLRVNGYSSESIESIIADWSTSTESAPMVDDEDDEDEVMEEQPSTSIWKKK